MSVPILLVIFNRKKQALRVIESIKDLKPSVLYINADGPRAHKSDEAELCAETRQAVLEAIDWPCDVKTRFLEENQGCAHAVSSGVSWFFEHEEYGVILEDDCVPHPDFFTFCQDLLECYKDDSRVMHITGNNFLKGRKVGKASYYWSQHPLIWGWATWRRAWQSFDLNYHEFGRFNEDGQIQNLYPTKLIQLYRLYHWRKLVKQGLKRPQSWAFAWAYAVNINHGLCIVPNMNLVSNCGFGDQATHGRLASDPDANLPLEPLGTMTHPAFMIPNKAADCYVLKHHNLYSIRGLLWKCFYKVMLKLS